MDSNEQYSNNKEVESTTANTVVTSNLNKVEPAITNASANLSSDLKNIKKDINFGLSIFIGVVISLAVAGLFYIFIERAFGRVIGKPVLYLYPESDINVTVKFENNNLVTVSYPELDNEWNVSVKKDGTILDSKGREYYALYWEELSTKDVDFREGFYVEDVNAINFLEDKLDAIGLTEKEANEFIMYWLPILKNNKKSLVYFELTEEKQNANKLIIEPTPDSLLRITMHVKKVNNKVNIKEQVLPHFERSGFTAVEWGGREY